MVIGQDRVAASVLHSLKKANSSVALTSTREDPDADEIVFCTECGAGVEVDHNSGVKKLAEELQFRHIPFAELSETLADVLIVTDPSLRLGYGDDELNPSYFRPPMLVVDLRDFPNETDLTAEARLRGCPVLKPSYVFAEQVAAQFKAVAEQELPANAFVDAINF